MLEFRLSSFVSTKVTQYMSTLKGQMQIRVNIDAVLLIPGEDIKYSTLLICILLFLLTFYTDVQKVSQVFGGPGCICL